MAGWAGAALDRAGFGGLKGTGSGTGGFSPIAPGGSDGFGGPRPFQTLGTGAASANSFGSLADTTNLLRPAPISSEASGAFGGLGNGAPDNFSVLKPMPSFRDNFSLLRQAPPSAQTMAMQAAAQAGGFGGGFGGAQGVGQAAGGALGNGGTLNNRDWSVLDSMNAGIAAASQKTGAPANLIKAMLMREGDGGRSTYVGPAPGRDPNDPVYAFNGIFKSTAESWGVDFNRMVQDKNYAIEAMGHVLASIKSYNNLPGWEDAAAFYFAGPNGYKNMNWHDGGNSTTSSYLYDPNGGVLTNWKALDAQAGVPPFVQQGIQRQMGTPQWQAATGGNAASSSVLAKVQQYVGVAYNWGSIPGKGADPWQTGWDCSGMIWWMDQNYGGGQVPRGSHYQYQWAQQTGNLNMNTATLQPGDAIFFDTGDRSGGGAHLNGASHVGTYLGGDKFIHAANKDVGTIISTFSSYTQNYRFLGGAKMAWSGGSAGAPSAGYTGTGYGQQAAAPAARPGSMSWFMSFLT